MKPKNFLGEFEELILLSVLKLGSDGYGVNIAETIQAASGKTVSTGALYTALSRLERKGYVLSRLGKVTNERGGKAKRFYSIKPLGVELLKGIQEVRERLLEGKE